MEGDSAYSFDPAVLLFADSADGIERGTRSILETGGRIGGARAIDDAIEWLDTQPTIDAVLVDVRHDHGDALDRLIDRLDLAARQGRHGSVVAVTPALLDIAAARASHRDVILLCDAAEADRAAALAVALAGSRGSRPWLGERDAEPMRLKQLSEEVGRIARTLAALSGLEGQERASLPTLPAPSLPQENPGGLTAASLRSEIRARRLREQYFDAALFADPAWDMMLDLMAAKLERRQVAVSSLCIAAAVPATTALRWIKTLTDEGLFLRTADPRDGRRVFIELSAAAADGLTAYFQALARTAARQTDPPGHGRPPPFA